MLENAWNKFWRDKRGRVVVWQMPNGWLIGWAVLTFLSLLFSGRVADVLSVLGSGVLIIWAIFETRSGVNYFRRALGLFVLLYALATFIKSF